MMNTAAGFIALSFLATVPAGPTPDTLLTVDQVLSRYVEAVGGRAALEALDTRIVTGRSVTDLPYQGPATEAVLEGVAAYPDRWSLTMRDSVTDRRWSDGTGVWHSRNGVVEGDDRGMRTRQSFLLDPRAPLRVADYFPGLRVTGRDRSGDREVWLMENDLDPTYNALRFDTESGLLVQIGHYWTLEDWARFDAVLIPTRIGQSRKGGSTTWYWDEVTHNEPVDPALFAGPGG